ncbi:phage head closure protein [Roseivivax isoporae]|uniref:Tail protein n=1 Tax=Roseivivax isoporae LMG 25204 TaxID=1449351 RepID=X7F839_9RHOB|nr:phage head closure protein [Roseivivax isoporae]ETX28244.1 tail protein [Roseivivax isoporae LMG 25204]
MIAPRLSHALVLQDPRQVQDGAGGFVQTWVPLGTLWAEVEARSGRESEGAAGPVSVGAFRITVRAAPEGSDARPRAGQRFALGARRFRITAVTTRDRAGHFLLCHAEEERAS